VASAYISYNRNFLGLFSEETVSAISWDGLQWLFVVDMHVVVDRWACQETHSNRLVLLAALSSSQMNDAERHDNDENGTQYNSKYYVENTTACVCRTYN